MGLLINLHEAETKTKNLEDASPFFKINPERNLATKPSKISIICALQPKNCDIIAGVTKIFQSYAGQFEITALIELVLFLTNI